MSDDQESTPEQAMRYRHETKRMPCKYCGEPIIVSIRTQKEPHHLECGLQEAVDNLHELKSHSGPRYERWRAGMLKWAQRQAGGGDPTPGDGGTSASL